MWVLMWVPVIRREGRSWVEAPIRTSATGALDLFIRDEKPTAGRTGGLLSGGQAGGHPG